MESFLFISCPAGLGLVLCWLLVSDGVWPTVKICYNQRHSKRYVNKFRGGLTNTHEMLHMSVVHLKFLRLFLILFISFFKFTLQLEPLWVRIKCINVIATVKLLVTSWHNRFSMCQSMLSTSHVPIPACLITTVVFSTSSTGVEQTLVAKLDGTGLKALWVCVERDKVPWRKVLVSN